MSDLICYIPMYETPSGSFQTAFRIPEGVSDKVAALRGERKTRLMQSIRDAFFAEVRKAEQDGMDYRALELTKEGDIVSSAEDDKPAGLRGKLHDEDQRNYFV